MKYPYFLENDCKILHFYSTYKYDFSEICQTYTSKTSFVSGRSLLNTTEETPESTTEGGEEKCMTPAIEQFPEPLMPQVKTLYCDTG